MAGRVLVGTCRSENREWISDRMLYNLPMADGAQLAMYERFSKLVLFDGDNAPLAFTIDRVTLADKTQLKHLGYHLSPKPHGKFYALFELGKALQPESVLNDSSAELFVCTSRWSGVIDKAFYDKPMPSCEGQSTKNLFLKLKPYLVRKSAQAISYQQSDFMSKLSPSEKVPFPGPSKKDAKFTFIDLFAGIGGFRLAMQSCGGRCVFSSEWDEKAQETYKANFGGDVAGDITKIDPTTIPNFDVLCGGFPCQPFSSIGKRQGFSHPTQGTLFFYIREIIRHHRPKAFFLENVPGLITHDDGNTFKVIMDTLAEELCYDTWFGVLDAADYGVPQHRRRLYIIGYSKELKLHFSPPKGNYCKRHVGIGRFIEKNAVGYDITKHLQKSYIFKKNDGHPEIVDSSSDFPVKTLCASYHKIQRITGTFVRDGKTGLRLLTENECKAIQGFPQSFVVPVSRTSMHHQFGNSVAVPVIAALSKVIAKQLQSVKE